MVYSVNAELILELEKLREMVNQSSEYTQKQLQNIDGNLLIGAIISFITALGISFLLNPLLNYWIPASFLSIILSMIYSLYLIISIKQGDKEKVLDDLSKVDGNKLNLTMNLFFNKILNPFIIGFELVLFVTVVALWLPENELIACLKIILTLLSILLILILFGIIKLFASVDYKDIINNSKKGKEYPMISFIAPLILLFPIILPLLGFGITYNIASNLGFFIIVLLLQFIFIILSASYFSSLSVKKELINNLTNFSNLHYQINCLILSKDINEEQLEKLKNKYLTAKQYEVLVDDSLKFVNFYYLLPLAQV